MKFVSSIILLAHFCILNGQNISFEFGSANFPEKSISGLNPEIKSPKKSNSSENFYRISYEQAIKNKLVLTGAFARYPMSTHINFKIRDDSAKGFGWGGTYVTRFDLNLIYNLFARSNFIVQPYIGTGLQVSKADQNTKLSGDFLANWITEIIPYVNAFDVEGESYSNTQFVPNFGLKVGYAFWNRLELFLEYQQVFGHKTIQEISMNYSYKGIEQPKAIIYSDGTGRFVSLGIGYRLFQRSTKKKSENKRINK